MILQESGKRKRNKNEKTFQKYEKETNKEKAMKNGHFFST